MGPWPANGGGVGRPPPCVSAIRELEAGVLGLTPTDGHLELGVASWSTGNGKSAMEAHVAILGKQILLAAVFTCQRLPSRAVWILALVSS